MAKKKLKTRIIRWWSKVFVNRRYKDELFRKVFQDKKDLLELYNAVNHTDYTDPALLEITTISNAIYLSMKNDLSFMIGNILNLYEHQSTFNPNMPVRGLSYFARLYETYMSKHEHDVYGRKLIRLPAPQYLVFYNGHKDQPDEVLLRLSDAFDPPTKANEHPVLECRVRMLNINMGHNGELMKNCRKLWEYARFVQEVNQNLDRGYSLERAVDTAIDTCIQQDVLKDILMQSRSEVLLMFLTKYDEKLHLRNTFEEGREVGFKQGQEAGLIQGKETGQKRILFLNQLLLESNRLDDLKKACSDEQYRETLFKEFKI